MNKRSRLLDYVKELGKASFISIILTLLALLIQTLIMHFTDASESILATTSAIIMTLSVAVASIYVSIKVRKRGWINGAIVGFLYIFIMVIISMIFLDDFVLNFYLLLKTVIAIVTGMISGMIGVNLK